MPGDEDPTRVVIATARPGVLLKEITQATAAVGESFSYRITVPETPFTSDLFDVRITDDLVGSAADLRLLGVTRISGSGSWTPVNTGTPTNPVIEDPASGIDIPAGEQIVIELEVVLEDTPTNTTGLAFTNTADYVYNGLDGNPSSERPGDPGTSPPMTIVGPDSVTVQKSGPANMALGTPGAFVLDLQNTGDGPAWNLTLVDLLPDGANAGTCDSPPTSLTAGVFEADGTTPVSVPLVDGTDYSVVFRSVPDCDLTITMLSAAATVGPGERLIVGYETLLDGDSQNGETLTNVAGATQWFSADGTDPDTQADRRRFDRVLTDGTVGTLDHEDASTAVVELSAYRFEKTVTNVTTGQSPATLASPGDVLRYRIFLENLDTEPLLNLAVVDELDRLNASPAFEPGSLQIISVPAGADTSGSSPFGGSNGTGFLDVRGLELLALNDALVIEFEATLAPVLANGSIVSDQARLSTNDVFFADSDDPGVNGPSDPFVNGDEDPTDVMIESAPAFRVEKVSADLVGDPDVLLAGETLRYTITVRNTGDDDATDASLRDAIPALTTYVAGSTTLNGVAVADGAGGIAPFVGGLLLYSPDDPTPGVLRAGGTDPGRTATLVFDVVVDPGAADGAVISNQAFVSAPGGGVSDQPSDDPGTPIPDDPTLDVVGAVPLLFAPKSAVLVVDAGTPGAVDPGDVLRYTIDVYNNGAAEATEVVLADAVPANTTYVADSVTLNGLPVGQPDGGVSPLVAGIPISSTDLTPPLPGVDEGRLSVGERATVTFDLQVDAGVPGGTLITNQARVSTAEVPNVLTDGDGDPATGPEPTVVVVGDGQQLAISKDVIVVGGGPALAGSQLEYVVRVTNIGTVPATDVLLTDDLDLPLAGQLSYVLGSATLDNGTAGVSVLGSVITADYSTTRGPLAPGAQTVLRFRADLDPGLAIGTTVTNTAMVYWNAATQNETASVSIAIGGTPGVGALSGSIWHDRDFDRLRGGGEIALVGWIVDLERNGQPIQSVTTDANGDYRIAGVAPNDQNGDSYVLRFRAPDAGANTAALGRSESAFTDGLQQISDVIVTSGSNLLALDLPIDPAGVVYDAIVRSPISGATVTMLSNGTPVSSSCFDDPNQQGQQTGSTGYYKFDLNFTDGSCQPGEVYVLEITPPGSSFTPGASLIIPSQTTSDLDAFAVPPCPGSAVDAEPLTAQHCEAQLSELAPPSSIPAQSAGTDYYLHLILDASASPGSSQLFNNHIPLDPVSTGVVSIRKTTPAINVSRGDLVPYEIVFSNTEATDFAGLTLVDQYPAGFRYVEGSARIDGDEVEPIENGRELSWTGLELDGNASRTVVLLLAVGAGVSEGEFVNRAWVRDAVGTAFSGEATATVRVVPDPTFDCTDVLGKVFDDANGDGVQDEGEKGLPNVRLMTVRGLAVNTDPHGRFHITCAVVPHESRGSNFVLKLDDRTLPSGYRMTTRQTQVARATRGKALRFSFGATIHRVVGLDLADAVFEPGTSQMRSQWRSRIPLLLEELEKKDSILRLSYLADLESESLVRARLAVIEGMIREAWRARGHDSLRIETEIYWRRGEAVDGLEPSPGAARDDRRSALEVGLPHVGAGPPGLAPPSGNAGERHLPIDPEPTPWAIDPDELETEAIDVVEERPVVERKVETIKLTGIVPPIHFESGTAEIAPDVVETLRSRLDEMQHLENVRLHLVGHADDQPLSARLRARYGDNEGLSRERAGEVAEFLQTQLVLPPESISFSWAGDALPLASNATPEGRAQNRRVEVEIWYDETEEEEAVEEVVISQEVKRLKVCRTDTVCMLRYREGHERRARVKNLIRPMNYQEEVGGLPDRFLQQIEGTLSNLADKQNVTVKIIAHTDDIPLEGRAARIYGDHLSLSRARARRVALQIKDALGLPTAAIASEGRGASRPVASNATPRGRAMNRRIEVEFWHDDPLLELPDTIQTCPDPADAETVTQVYEPPWGRIEAVPIEDGDALLPGDLAERLRRALDDVADRMNPRLRFVGYTRNERLTRRQADAYGDDVGLSTARARRVMERVQGLLELSDAAVEHEGRGFVHSEDVVNGGFLQGETDHVVIQVVYDELAVIDDYDGIEITEITRELTPQEPLSLNLMRITVDGVPIDDPERSSADIQRCTDVELDSTDIAFQFDDLVAKRRLSVTSAPPATAGDPVRFRMYSNYPHSIERAEVRIFEAGQSVRDVPLAVVEVDRRGFARWQPESFASRVPFEPLAFVLRAYGEDELWDETAPQSLWLLPREEDSVRALPASAEVPEAAGSGISSVAVEGASSEDPLLAGYGESEPTRHNIPLESSGSVRVAGNGIPPGHTVWLAGTELPVDEEGRFVGEVLLPAGLHTVEVAVLDEEGNGELFLRDLELARDDWFFMGLADLTLSADISGDPPSALDGNNSKDPNEMATGRLAFFLNGKFGDDWRLTASADTREDSVSSLFSNFLDKSPESLFRRIDPDYYYPTFGDASTIEEMAPTLGKFYVRLENGDDHLLWGNFTVSYDDNELALVERALYGGNLLTQSKATTSFGERRYALDGFVADPGTITSRDEFRGTGGSVYFLRQQDLLMGSERLRVEVRDKDSGLVRQVVHLQPEIDYDIDYLHGRVLLTEPLSAIADDDLLVRNDGLSGNEAWLVAQYEYTPGFDSIDTLNVGGQGHVWLNDMVKLGVTANRNDGSGVDTSLYGADLTLRHSASSWFKVQAGRSDGRVSTSLRSDDGGFFFPDPTEGSGSDDAYAYRADLVFDLKDIWDDYQGRFSVYAQRREAGYSAPGLDAASDTNQFGGEMSLPVTESLEFVAKADHVDEDEGLETTTAEVDASLQVGESWGIRAGVRHDERDDNSAVEVVTQETGDRTDAVVQVEFAPDERLQTYAFGQASLQATGDREKNRRGGIGGAYRVNERLSLDGEVSHGDLGPAAQLGSRYQHSARSQYYMNYALDNERGADGLHARRGNLTVGSKSRLSDSISVYAENQYQHSAVTGLTRSVGMDYAPNKIWNIGVNWESGETRDRRTRAETERRAGGIRGGLRWGKLHLSSGIEYIFNDTEYNDIELLSKTKSERTTWLFRNNASYQWNEDGKILAKFNHAISDSSQGDFFDGGFTEAILGYAYRPVAHDRLNALLKYTYFYNVPTVDQVGQNGTPSQFIQKSHVAALDLSYDLTARWTLGGKYAYRRSEVSLDRDDTDFFDNDAHLFILRTDWRFLKAWETSVEGRLLELPDLDERRAGALAALYRYFGDHLKAGVGYNFTDFSEDLTDLSYDHHGVFFNVIGTF